MEVNQTEQPGGTCGVWTGPPHLRIDGDFLAALGRGIRICAWTGHPQLRLDREHMLSVLQEQGQLLTPPDHFDSVFLKLFRQTQIV